MRRFLALATALIALLAAGFLWTRDRPVAVAQVVPPPFPVASPDVAEALPPLIAPASSVNPADREARRFARYDKDKNAEVSRDEYLTARKKAFARLDRDRDGQLDFDEYAAATARRFDRADRNADGELVAAEFATTAVKRRSRAPIPCVPDA